ncbi:hypothetical protein C8R46DRAFT_1237682 [Mycena filopes]|nr:hypothetical protein C8R46DRAFT_1237682 [Mycena filopes]
MGMNGMGGGMGMMGMGMNGMGMGGMNAMGMGMMGGMPLPMGGARTRHNAADAARGSCDSHRPCLHLRPFCSVASSPGAGPSSASVSSSPSVHEEDEGELDEEEGEVVVAVRDSATGSGTMRRAGTVRATRQQPHIPDVSTASTVEAAAAVSERFVSRSRGDCTSGRILLFCVYFHLRTTCATGAACESTPHTTPRRSTRTAATAPVLRARRATAAADAPIPTQPAVAVIPAPLAMPHRRVSAPPVNREKTGIARTTRMRMRTPQDLTATRTCCSPCNYWRTSASTRTCGRRFTNGGTGFTPRARSR